MLPTGMPAVAAALLSSCLLICCWRIVAQWRAHVDVPAVGYVLPGLSMFSTIKAIFRWKEMMQEGYTKYPNGIFKLPNFTGWTIVVSGPSLEEALRLPESKLSFRRLANEQLQMEIVLGPEMARHDTHIYGIRQLTRHTEVIMPDLHGELVRLIKERLTPKTPDLHPEELPLLESAWVEVKILDTLLDIIHRLNQRMFVGLPLGHDEKWVKAANGLVFDLSIRGLLLWACPSIFRRPFKRFLDIFPSSIRTCEKMLGPQIEERTVLPADERPNDMVTWLMDRTSDAHSIVSAFIFVDIAAHGTLAMTWLQTLYYMTLYSQYLSVLREEAAQVIEECGWTKDAMDRLGKLDSFIRETQRMSPLASVSTQRLAVDDFTFSNGVRIPKGTIIQGVATPVHVDPTIYDDPNDFKPFRFFSDDPDVPKKDMATISLEYLPFSYGRNACPGRWYAQTIIKLGLAHLLLYYDFEMEKKYQGTRPPNIPFQAANVPYPWAKMRFRARRRDAGDSFWRQSLP